jgi:hypothetical protein
MSFTIAKESPLGADLALLMQRHTEDMHADTPPESIHMMDASQLDIPEVSFFVLREAGEALAMGAFKRIDADHAEIKSMHVLHEAAACRASCWIICWHRPKPQGFNACRWKPACSRPLSPPARFTIRQVSPIARHSRAIALTPIRFS